MYIKYTNSEPPFAPYRELDELEVAAVYLVDAQDAEQRTKEELEKAADGYEKATERLSVARARLADAHQIVNYWQAHREESSRAQRKMDIRARVETKKFKKMVRDCLSRPGDDSQAIRHAVDAHYEGLVSWIRENRSRITDSEDPPPKEDR